MREWHTRRIPFRYQLGDLTLFTIWYPLQVKSVGLADNLQLDKIEIPEKNALLDDSKGCLIRGAPITDGQPCFSKYSSYIRYMPLQYQHSYISMNMSFADYGQKFSSKTRSTLGRKVRKYAKHCGGEISWKVYSRPEEMPEFFEHANTVSRLTYQEKLFDAGIPDSAEFKERAAALAEAGNLRAFILFDGNKPVSYLFCPIHDDILIYAYLGYDPGYSKLSVGMVLQWLALESLFDEAKFRYFDFTEGQSRHKQQFATDHRLCANVYFLPRTPLAWLLLRSHWMTDRFSRYTGDWMSKIGLKTRFKRLIRGAA